MSLEEKSLTELGLVELFYKAEEPRQGFFVKMESSHESRTRNIDGITALGGPEFCFYKDDSKRGPFLLGHSEFLPSADAYMLGAYHAELRLPVRHLPIQLYRFHPHIFYDLVQMGIVTRRTPIEALGLTGRVMDGLSQIPGLEKVGDLEGRGEELASLKGEKNRRLLGAASLHQLQSAITPALIFL